jgi:hypothetical protein
MGDVSSTRLHRALARGTAGAIALARAALAVMALLALTAVVMPDASSMFSTAQPPSGDSSSTAAASTQKASAVSPVGELKFSAGAALGVQAVTATTFAPTTIEYDAVLYIQLDNN